MRKLFTLNTSGVPLFIALFVILFSACSTRVEKEAKDQAGLETAKIVKELPVITVATLEAPTADEGYFDLIVESADCLGENIWIGGKLETNTGATPRDTEFEVTQLTATGISSNMAYTFKNKEGTIRAVSTEQGAVALQLQEGLLQLQPIINTSPIEIAYHKRSDAGEQGLPKGYWSCK